MHLAKRKSVEDVVKQRKRIIMNLFYFQKCVLKCNVIKRERPEHSDMLSQSRDLLSV